MLEHFGSLAMWLEALTIIVLGVFSFITLFDRKKKERHKELIENFEKTIESMRLRMDEMQAQIDEHTEAHQDNLQKIAKLNGENETLKSVLLGKDPASETYRSKSLELLQMLVDELKRHDAFVRKAHPEIA